MLSPHCGIGRYRVGRIGCFYFNTSTRPPNSPPQITDYQIFKNLKKLNFQITRNTVWIKLQ